MKILHAIFSREFAGSETYAASLARLQAAFGHEVTLLVLDAGAGYVARVRAAAAPANVETLATWVPSFLRGIAAARLVMRFSPDIVHTHLGQASRQVGAAAQRAGVPHVATLHLRYRNRDYARANGLICVADWLRSEIPATYRGRIETIWNWLPDMPPGGDAGALLRKSLKATPATHVFGSVGRLMPQKGMDVLIDAFRRAFQPDADVRLVIVGGGPLHAQLQAVAAAEPRITLTGYRDDAAVLYPAFDTYVSAARHEPFGLTILEAMHAGCRLVCTRTQGPLEFLAGRTTVQWAEPSDAASLADAMRIAAQMQGRMAWNMDDFEAVDPLARIDNFYRSLARPNDH